MRKQLPLFTDQEVQKAINLYYESNRLSLEIYDYLLRQFIESSKDFSPISNIFGLFFHDLMIHFSGILIQREYLRQDDLNAALFPFVSTGYARRPFIIDQNFYINKARKPNLLRDLWRSSGLVPLAVGEAAPFDIRDEWLKRKSLSVLGKYQPFCKAYLANRKHQIATLCGAVSALAEKFSIPEKDRLIKNWEEYGGYHTSSDEWKIKENEVVLGTRAILQNRKLAMNFLQQGKEVIGITHGEITNTVFNEPLFGYAELGLCSVLIDYGERRLDAPMHEPLVKPNRVLSRTSASVKQIQKRSSSSNYVNRRSNQNGTLYIPTLYSGDFHYGPYRGFNDDLYIKWQFELIETIPDVTIKPHPKSIQPTLFTREEKRALQRCYVDYDVIILDYYSTAATLMMATDKPIIFFDVGLRNLTPEYNSLLKQRCHYVEIDWASDLNDQIRQAINALSNDAFVEVRNNLAQFSVVSKTSENWRGIRWLPYRGVC